MATTNLGITELVPAQNDKVTTINDALEFLDNAGNAVTEVAITGDVVLTAAQQNESGVIRLTGTPGSAFTVSLLGTARVFVIDNTTDATATVEVDPDDDGADGDTIDIEAGATKLVVSDGTDVTSVGGGSDQNLVDWKDSVRVATTANGTLASGFEDGDIVDGVTLATGDRILLKDQTAGAENGIYTVNASGAPTRAEDFDEDAEVTSGAAVVVEEGTANSGKLFLLTTTGAITVGTTAIAFTEISGGGGVDIENAGSSVATATTIDFIGAGVNSITDDGGGQVTINITGAAGAPPLLVAVSDETTALTAGTAKITFRAPEAMTLTDIKASLTTASTSGDVTVDANVNGFTILSTKITIEATEKTSKDAVTQPVISSPSIAADDEITIDIDAAGTDAAGLKVALIQ